MDFWSYKQLVPPLNERIFTMDYEIVKLIQSNTLYMQQNILMTNNSMKMREFEAQIIKALHTTLGQELNLPKRLLKWTVYYKNLPELSQVLRNIWHTILAHNYISLAYSTLQILCWCTSSKGGHNQSPELFPELPFITFYYLLLCWQSNSVLHTCGWKSWGRGKEH